MNTVKITRSYICLLLTVLVMSGCDEEDKVYLSTPEAGKLTATTNNLVLDYDESEEPVLSFAWDNNNTLYFSNSDEPQKDLVTVYFQISTTEDFSENVITSKESGLSKKYTSSELNVLTQNLNIPPFEATDIYFRTRYTTGSNIDGVFSNVVTVNVTGYYIDMTIATLLNKAQTEVVGYLYSPKEDGYYTGFVYASAKWMNFFMVEGNGKIWGNRRESPAFILDANNYGNFWYPEPAGCYYTEMETKINEWACIYIPVLTVTGDISTDLEFEGESLKWFGPYTATSAGTLTIKIETKNAKLYNISTGTDEKNGVDTSHIISIDGSEDIELSVPAAGTYTLVLDLSDPTNWTCTLQ